MNDSSDELLQIFRGNLSISEQLGRFRSNNVLIGSYAKGENNQNSSRIDINSINSFQTRKTNTKLSFSKSDDRFEGFGLVSFEDQFEIIDRVGNVGPDSSSRLVRQEVNLGHFQALNRNLSANINSYLINDEIKAADGVLSKTDVEGYNFFLNIKPLSRLVIFIGTAQNMVDNESSTPNSDNQNESTSNLVDSMLDSNDKTISFGYNSSRTNFLSLGYTASETIDIQKNSVTSDSITLTHRRQWTRRLLTKIGLTSVQIGDGVKRIKIDQLYDLQSAYSLSENESITSTISRSFNNTTLQNERFLNGTVQFPSVLLIESYSISWVRKLRDISPSISISQIKSSSIDDKDYNVEDRIDVSIDKAFRRTSRASFRLIYLNRENSQEPVRIACLVSPQATPKSHRRQFFGAIAEV